MINGVMLGAAATALGLIIAHPSPRRREMLAGADQSTIFVSIASYRDDDCSQTLRSMFSQADHPHRIFAGVCQQNKPGEQAEECVDPTLPWRQNVRVITMPHTDAKGPTYARYKCATLYNGETYFMQIDSHTTFVKGWDRLVIEDLAACPSAKPILSFYPHDSKGSPDPASVPVLCKSKFTNESLVTFEAVTMDAAIKAPKPVPFVAGGFMFGPGSIPRDVPFDPTLDHLFNGEEIAYSARLWTSGYDFFAPRKNPLFHYYTRKEKPKFWEDIKDYSAAQKQSQHKVVRMLGLDGQPPSQQTTYGLGTARSLAEYLSFAGLDPKTKTSRSQEKFCG